MRRSYADTRFGQIHYREAGTGDPVVLLHGARFDSTYWEGVAGLLGATRRALAVDWPPHGMSDRPDTEPQTISDYAQMVLAFADAIGLGRFKLVGSHSGSVVALDLAATHPERVERLVLVGFPVMPTKEERENVAPRAHLADEVVHNPAEIARIEAEVARFSPAEEPDRFRNLLVARLLVGHRAEWPYRALRRYDVIAGMEQVRCPTLIVQFEGEVVPAEKARLGLVHIARSEWRDVPGGDWQMPLANPAPVADALAEFLDR